MTRLKHTLDIESAEFRPFLLMLLLSFLMGGSNVFADTASSALFVAEYGAAQLPWVYIAAALVMLIMSYGYAQIQQRVPLISVMSGSMIFLFVTTAGIKYGLDVTGDKRFVFAALVWYRQIFLFIDLVFWGVAGILFSIQQGKRLFGLISTGNFIARILGYLIVPLIVTMMGTANLLYLASGLLAVSWVIVTRITRGVAHKESAPAVAVSAEKQHTLSQNRRYLSLIFATYGIGSIVYYLIGFNFYAAAGQQFANNADQLATFFGLFSGVLNVAVLLVNSLVTSRILRRLGLVNTLIVRTSILFALATATIIIVLGSPGNLSLLFILALASRFGDLLLYFGIYRPSWSLLYQPLAKSLRGRVQSNTEGSVGALALGFAGLLLIFIGPENIILNSILLLCAVGAWNAVMIGVRREYPQMLRRALYKRLLSEQELNLKEADTLTIIRARLSSEHPSDVIYAIDLLERVGPPDLDEAIIGSLTHKNAHVRLEAARRAARLGITDALPRLRRMVQKDDSPEARIEAATAWAILVAEADVADVLALFGPEAEPDIQEAVMTGLLRGTSDTGQREARAHLRQLLGGNSAERIQACNIIRDARRNDLHSWLVAPLNDQDVAVRHAAIHAAGETNAPELWEHLLTKLDEPLLESDAIHALSTSGQEVLPLIMSEFEHAVTPSQQLRFVEIASRIGHSDALFWLTTFIAHPHAEIRSVALRGLYRGRYVAQPAVVPHIEAQVSAEIEHAAHVFAALSNLDEREAFDLLFAALEGLLREIQQRIFRLLSFTNDRSLLKRIEENLRLDAPDRRAYALELLDMALPHRIKQPLLPLIESAELSARLARLRGYYSLPDYDQADWLRVMITGETVGSRPFSPWVRASAIHAAGKLRLDALIEPIQAALDSDDALVLQTAEWILHTEFNLSSIRTVFMMPTIEKVIILRSVPLFTTIPESILVRVADLLNEVVLDEGRTLFEKGAYGDKMYIIVTGKVRVHDGEETLNFLSDRDLFGEMALLDPEPRVASVTTVEPCLLLTLDQEPLFELMENQPAVARGIISVLSSHLRDRVSDLRVARNRISELEAVPA